MERLETLNKECIGRKRGFTADGLSSLNWFKLVTQHARGIIHVLRYKPQLSISVNNVNSLRPSFLPYYELNLFESTSE